MVSGLDAAVGVVVSSLKRTGQFDRTVIVFTADNGAPEASAFSMGDDPAMSEALSMGYGTPGKVHWQSEFISSVRIRKR